MGLATFQGKHNANKSKTYWLLTQEYESGRWLRPSEIHDILGVPLRSLLTSLPRWCRWHRLSRRKRAGYLEYRITQKGIQWFREWAWLMPLSRYMAEIREWQEKHKSSLRCSNE